MGRNPFGLGISRTAETPSGPCRAKYRSFYSHHEQHDREDSGLLGPPCRASPANHPLEARSVASSPPTSHRVGSTLFDIGFQLSR